MDRTARQPGIWAAFNPASDKAVLTRYRRDGQMLTICSVPHVNLDKILLHGPDFFLQPECKIIKEEEKIMVGYVPLEIGGKVKRFHIKQHNRLSFSHRLGSLFSASAAMRAFSAADILLKAGHATARPVAALEYRVWGVLTKSVYLSEEIPGAKTVESYWREDLIGLKGVNGYLERRAFLKSLGSMFNSLHQQKIYHNDLKASNILVCNGGHSKVNFLSLVDLQGVKKCFYISNRRKVKNLAQLNRTLGFFLSKTEKLFLLKAYRAPCFRNRTEKRQLVKIILNETARQVMRAKWRESGSK